ncbi:Prokineticin receptor 2 [Exaiptasia diaphana]|nr:Prokineticin receptor 2 [Exaiptasia diaphana]
MNSTNISSGNDICDCEHGSDLEFNAKRIIAIIMISCGLALNIFVVVLAVKYTVRKNLHHLIINMAIADFLSLLKVVFTEFHWLSGKHMLLIYPDGILGDILCKVEQFLTNVTLRVSLITLLIISIERFRATRQTLEISRPYTSKERIKVVSITWAIPMIMDSYLLYCKKTDEDGSCGVADKDQNLYYSIRLVTKILAIIVVCVIFGLCIQTTKRLSRVQAIQTHMNEEQRKARARRTQAACTSPGSVYLLVASLGGSTHDATSYRLMTPVGPGQPLSLPNGAKLLADKAYPGAHPLLTAVRAQQMRLLNRRDRRRAHRFNRRLSSRRIKVEHVFKEMKTYRAISSIWRHQRWFMPVCIELAAFLAERRVSLFESI